MSNLLSLSHPRLSHSRVQFLSFVLLGLFLLSQPVEALFSERKIPYYTAQFYQVDFEQVESAELRHFLFKILSSYHFKTSRKDKLVDRCNLEDERCYIHSALSYRRARELLFGFLHLQKDASGYFVRCVYCSLDLGSNDFPAGGAPAPGKIPSAHVMNAEHTWPQSKFTNQHPISIQRSDLHALYPVTSRTNSSRSNHEFADINQITHETCPEARKGRTHQDGDNLYFEPPDEHKGNVARALFYFAVRYEMPISEIEEEALRRWHLLDPVDEFEVQRNEEIFKIQGNRNPFVDYPELIDFIDNF